MPRPKLILFDLWDTLAYIKASDAKPAICAAFGIDGDRFRPINRMLCLQKRIDDDVLQDICGLASVEPTSKNKAKLRRILNTRLRFSIYADALEIIPELRKEYKLAILSNIYPTTARFFEEGAPKFLRYFDDVVFSCDVGMLKPDEKAFRLILGKFKLRPQDVLMVGDRFDLDVVPAKKLGMNAMLVERGPHKKGLRELPRLLARS